MIHLFEMGDKCLMEEYDDKGDVTPPLFPGTCCKSPNGHRTCRNAENVIGNDVAWGMLPLAESRQIASNLSLLLGRGEHPRNQPGESKPTLEHSLRNPWMLCILGFKMWHPQSSSLQQSASRRQRNSDANEWGYLRYSVVVVFSKQLFKVVVVAVNKWI